MEKSFTALKKAKRKFYDTQRILTSPHFQKSNKSKLLFKSVFNYKIYKKPSSRDR
jgi:hypothetical protein